MGFHMEQRMWNQGMPKFLFFRMLYCTKSACLDSVESRREEN
jgi:hypothetical protein